MGVCGYLKGDGDRCRAQAMRSSQWCYVHDPALEETRRRNNAKGGRRGGRGRPVNELAALRSENADIRRRLLEDELPPNVAAVATQSINTDIRAVVAALKAREAEELEARLEELERLLEARKEGDRWGA